MNRNKPNILMIVADQHRYDCTGYANKYPVRTPNLDKLASEGMCFTQAYTVLPSCCPARQALLSGKRPEKLGALWNYNITLETGTFEPTEFCWTKELQKEGYKSAFVGKWNIHEDYDPTYYGYDYYVSEEEYKNFRSTKYPANKLSPGFFGGKDDVQLEDTKTHFLARKASEFIQELSNREGAWHVRLDFSEPHPPCNPASPFYEMYQQEKLSKWDSFDDNFLNKPYMQKQQLLSWGIEDYTWEDWEPVIKRYYGVVSQMDDAIGRVLEALNQSGAADNTIVIYTSDHGDLCGGHRMMDKHYVLYDDVIKVPLIIKWPGVTEAASRCENFVYNVLDIAPTILEILNEDIPEELDGRSLLPIFRGSLPGDWRTQVMCSFNGQQFGLYTSRAIRDKEWKYVWNTADVDELYNVEKDPGELNNLVYNEEFSSVLRKMRKSLYDELVSAGDGLVLIKNKNSSSPNPWTKHQLLENKKL